MEKLTFDFIIEKIRKIDFGQVDLVVAIGKGGIIPASLIRNFLDVDMEILWLRYRGKNNEIINEKPRILKKFPKIEHKKILLVDDVSRTGATLTEAKKLLKGNEVKTFVLNGKADFNIINSEECFSFPWS